MFASNPAQFLQPARMPVDMNCQDRAGPRRDRRFHLCRVKGVMLGFNVDKDWPDLVPKQGVSRGDEGVWSCDDIAADAHPLERNLEGKRTIREEAKVIVPAELDQLLAELI